MTEIPDILPDWHVHAWVSALVVYGVGVVGYLVAFVLAVRGGARWSRRAKLADASVDPARPLVAGEAVLVGVVEAWPDAGPAVVVEIEQHGSEHESSGSWSHVWREIDRRMRVRPFYLRHASGERVLVEAGGEALLLDDLDGLVHLSSTSRVRTAELTPGETVIATGVLERGLRVGAPGGGSGYRDGAMGWVLRPASREQMVLSTEPLGVRFRKRAQRSAVVALATSIVFCGVHALLLGYHLRVWRGETVVGTVVERLHWTTRDDEGGEHAHYLVSAETPGGVVTDHVYTAGFERVAPRGHVAVRAVPSAPWASSLGATPTAHSVALLLVLIGGVIVLVTGRLAVPRGWYESKVTDRGGGRLPK
jgi:hypothetical protein